MIALQDPPVESPAPPPPPPPPAKPAKPRGGWQRAERGSPAWIVSTSLFWLAAVLLAFAAYVALVSQLQYQAAQSKNFDALRLSLAEGTTPVSQTDPDGNLTPIGTPIALISVPRIGLNNVVVVEGTSSKALQAGPGHQRDTRFPGQAGLSVLQGRAGAYGGPFSQIDALRPGDTITVTTGQDVSQYKVIGQRREGDPTTPIAAGEGRLTLISAGGYPFMPEGLVYVDAKLVSDPKDGSVVYARDLPSEEKPMGTMPDTLPVTILCLQAVVVLVLAAVWAWYRWGRRRAWLIGGPAVLVAVVLVGSRVTQLLPNLL